MKPLKLISSGMLPLLLGSVVPAYGQRDRREREATPQKQAPQGRPQPANPRDARQREQHREQQQRQGQQAARQRDRQRGGETRGMPPPGSRGPVMERRSIWQGHRARSWRTEHRSWQQRGGYQGYRIPEDRYRTHFGPSHVFRVYSQPVIVFEGRPRFQFGGFWFSVLDPWPEYWSDRWYDNDDVYIDYSGDGYYLYNHRHPMDRLAVSVSIRMN